MLNLLFSPLLKINAYDASFCWSFHHLFLQRWLLLGPKILEKNITFLNSFHLEVLCINNKMSRNEMSVLFNQECLKENIYIYIYIYIYIVCAMILLYILLFNCKFMSYIYSTKNYVDYNYTYTRGAIFKQWYWIGSSGKMWLLHPITELTNLSFFFSFN